MQKPLIAGLLHDLGKLVMSVAFGEDEMDAVAREHPIGAARAALEHACFGVDHALAGEIFAREAFFEARIFNAIGAHHGEDIPSAVAPTVGGLAGRVAALERAASTDEVTVGTAPACGTADVQAVLDAAAAASSRRGLRTCAGRTRRSRLGLPRRSPRRPMSSRRLAGLSASTQLRRPGDPRP